VFTAKFNDVAESVPTIAQPEADILIYPNPAHSTLTISSTEKIKSVAISNVLGQLLVSEQPTAQKTEINVANLPAGAYVVRINDVVRKFVKE
jgi:hypothetical protein